MKEHHRKMAALWLPVPDLMAVLTETTLGNSTQLLLVLLKMCCSRSAGKTMIMLSLDRFQPPQTALAHTDQNVLKLHLN